MLISSICGLLNTVVVLYSNTYSNIQNNSASVYTQFRDRSDKFKNWLPCSVRSLGLVKY